MRRRSRPTPDRPAGRQARAERRSPLFLVTGLVIGLFSGLAFAWLVFPARLVGIAPEELSPQAREEYRVMISLAFASSGDLGRAQARLGLLGEGDPVRQLNSQAQLALLEADSQLEARALGQLAAALAGASPGGAGQEAEGAPALASGAGYEIIERQLICEGEGGAPLLRIYLLTDESTPASGLNLQLSNGESGEERVTGSSPEQGAGYAEFVLDPEATYALAIAGEPVLQGIRARQCEEESGLGDWLVTLQEQ